VIKIKRRVVLHGDSTLTVSLPSTWVKRFNVQKGDELNVEENNKNLIIIKDKENDLNKAKEINIGSLNRLGKSYITSMYRNGFDEISLKYENIDYIKTIQDIISKDITGFEIVKQGKNNCTIKDITGHNKDEFDIILRRIWRLILNLSDESLKAIKSNDTETLKNIHLMDYSINKFSNYCLRLLAKRNKIDYDKIPLYYCLIRNLEEIADQYKDMCDSYLNRKDKIDDNLITLFTKTNNYLCEFYELFYEYNEEKIEELFKKTKVLLNKRLYPSDTNMSFYLFYICKDIRNLLPLLVEIKL